MITTVREENFLDSPIPLDSAMPCNGEQKEIEPSKRDVKILDTGNYEKGFSLKKYIVAALAVTVVSGVIFSVSTGAAIVGIAIASWFIGSAALVMMHRVAVGTRMEKPVRVLHAVVTEINSAVASAMLFPRTLFKSYHSPKGNPNGLPILMVNGYLSFGSTWNVQREGLIKAGYGPIYTINVGSGKSIKSYAKKIQKKVEQIQNDTNKNDLILIGHSKGGLVSSYYATYLACENKTNVTDVITIGSPLAGTPAASIGLGYDASEMKVSSKFHEELREKIREHSNIRFFHIGSTMDEIVPLSSALLGDNLERQYITDDLGHLGLLFSSRVTDKISSWLSVSDNAL